MQRVNLLEAMHAVPAAACELVVSLRPRFFPPWPHVCDHPGEPDKLSDY